MFVCLETGACGLSLATCAVEERVICAVTKSASDFVVLDFHDKGQKTGTNVQQDGWNPYLQ